MKFYCNSAKLKGRRRRKKTVGTCFPFFLGGFFRRREGEDRGQRGVFAFSGSLPFSSLWWFLFFFLALGGNKVILEMPRVWGGSHCFVKGGHTALSSTTTYI